MRCYVIANFWYKTIANRSNTQIPLNKKEKGDSSAADTQLFSVPKAQISCATRSDNMCNPSAQGLQTQTKNKEGPLVNFSSRVPQCISVLREPVGSSVLLNYVSSPQLSSQRGQERCHKHSELHSKHKLTSRLQATTLSTNSSWTGLNRVCVIVPG